VLTLPTGAARGGTVAQAGRQEFPRHGGGDAAWSGGRRRPDGSSWRSWVASA